MGLVGIWVRPECRCSLSGSAHLTLVNFDRCNYLPKHFMKSTDVPYKMFSTSFAFISYVPIGPADPWDSIHFRPDPWDHGPMSGLFLHRLLLRYCYTPTLVWDVTNEKRLTPLIGWVGGPPPKWGGSRRRCRRRLFACQAVTYQVQLSQGGGRIGRPWLSGRIGPLRARPYRPHPYGECGP